MRFQWYFFLFFCSILLIFTVEIYQKTSFSSWFLTILNTKKKALFIMAFLPKGWKCASFLACFLCVFVWFPFYFQNFWKIWFCVFFFFFFFLFFVFFLKKNVYFLSIFFEKIVKNCEKLSKFVKKTTFFRNTIGILCIK